MLPCWCFSYLYRSFLGGSFAENDTTPPPPASGPLPSPAVHLVSYNFQQLLFPGDFVCSAGWQNPCCECED